MDREWLPLDGRMVATVLTRIRRQYGRRIMYPPGVRTYVASALPQVGLLPAAQSARRPEDETCTGRTGRRPGPAAAEQDVEHGHGAPRWPCVERMPATAPEEGWRAGEKRVPIADSRAASHGTRAWTLPRCIRGPGCLHIPTTRPFSVSPWDVLHGLRPGEFTVGELAGGEFPDILRRTRQRASAQSVAVTRLSVQRGRRTGGSLITSARRPGSCACAPSGPTGTPTRSSRRRRRLGRGNSSLYRYGI